MQQSCLLFFWEIVIENSAMEDVTRSVLTEEILKLLDLENLCFVVCVAVVSGIDLENSLQVTKKMKK
ncbi:unnamed protein product [Arabidopsis halleri]